MFSYDAILLQAVEKPVQSVADVIETMQTIGEACVDGDGLKWFNWLYLQVTRAVAARIDAGAFSNGQWMADLDVQFARLYFGALQAALTGQPLPDCWNTLFSRRQQVMTARIQFALAGINAHINRDLPMAILKTCTASGKTPEHGSAEYLDYTALNATLDGMVDMAKKELFVRLLGEPLPHVAQLEDVIAAWSVMAAREAAWQHAEVLWHLRGAPMVLARFMDTLDGLTTLASKALLVTV